MSFIKKLIAKGDPSSPSKCVTNPDIQPIGSFLQEKFSRGINYNMKIVIRGDRNVGKTALFTRLKGGPFKEDYVPSTEIQVASIHWNERNHSDVVKVEVWDVIDKGKPRPPTKGSKFRNTSAQNSVEPCLDANFLNVYKGAHGVIIVMDMTKSWTFDYVRRELPRIPADLPILILSNHRDMGHHRTVTEDQVRSYLKEEAAGLANSNPGNPVQSRTPKRLVPVQYCEASMRNGFGLVYVHRFFSVPFFCLKRAVLRQQLRQIETELHRTVDELAAPGGPLATTQLAYETYVRIRQAQGNHQPSNSANQSYTLTDVPYSRHNPAETSRNVVSGDMPTSREPKNQHFPGAYLQNACDRSITNPHRECHSVSSTTPGAVLKTSAVMCNTPAAQTTGYFSDSESDNEDELDEFVFSDNLSIDTATQPFGTRHTSNPKVLSFQEDLDPNDVLSIRLEQHSVPIGQRPADADSWENVTLSRTHDPSDSEDEEATSDASRQPVEPSTRGNEIASDLRKHAHGVVVVRDVHRPASPESFNHKQIRSSKYQDPSPEPPQIGPQPLVVERSGSPDGRSQFTAVDENPIDDQLVQSVLTSVEDEDALERFLTGH